MRFEKMFFFYFFLKFSLIKKKSVTRLFLFTMSFLLYYMIYKEYEKTDPEGVP